MRIQYFEASYYPLVFCWNNNIRFKHLWENWGTCIYINRVISHTSFPELNCTNIGLLSPSGQTEIFREIPTHWTVQPCPGSELICTYNNPGHFLNMETRAINNTNNTYATSLWVCIYVTQKYLSKKQLKQCLIWIKIQGSQRKGLNFVILLHSVKDEDQHHFRCKSNKNKV